MKKSMVVDWCLAIQGFFQKKITIDVFFFLLSISDIDGGQLCSGGFIIGLKLEKSHRNNIFTACKDFENYNTHRTGFMVDMETWINRVANMPLIFNPNI